MRKFQISPALRAQAGRAKKNGAGLALSERSESKGFTLIELLVVMTVFLILAGLATTNILNFRETSSINAFLYTIIADIKNQQIKSMTGDTEGRGIPDTYGIFIEPAKYTLFHGQTYSESDPSNFSIELDDQYVLSTTFPLDSLNFATGSGEIVGFSGGQSTITIIDERTSEQKVIELNKYGVITSAD